MSKGFVLTPEEVIQVKKRRKSLLYVSIMLGTVVLSALVTILVNKI